MIPLLVTSKWRNGWWILMVLTPGCSFLHAFTTTTTSAPISQRSILNANKLPSLRVTASKSQDNAVPASSPYPMTIDPLVSRLLLLSNNDDDDGDLPLEGDFGSLLAASQGLAVWRACLLKGRLPTLADFAGTTPTVWPVEPLYTHLLKAMADLQFPRFVLRHPSTVSAVLVGVVRMAAQFKKQQYGIEPEDEDMEDEDDEYEWDDILEDRWTNDEELADEDNKDSLLVEDDDDELLGLSDDEEQIQLAIDIVTEGLTNQWSGVIRGVQALDQIFGVSHGLLDVQQQQQSDNSNTENSLGFGWNDGVWQHSGWRLLPGLQREISAMPELRDLIAALGRRPTAQDSDAMNKFVPRRLDDQGASGAQHDPAQRASVQGITLSGSLSEMLPSEAILLVKKRHGRTLATNGDQQHQYEAEKVLHSPFRRLFLAKMVESKLLSYEASGWQDVPSSNVPNPRYLSRLPSAPGGPILICLDTSWSMTGRREQLSKAVVLACVAAAHKQKRDIQVVAFSSARNVMETGPITADADGVRRLLEFLSSSFGGGTDVTGALKHAMRTVGSTDTLTDVATATNSSKPATDKNKIPQRRQTMNDLNSMAAADILLVTDGEIPDPPVSSEIMEALDRLKQRAGVQVHGLLVGKRESAPLAKLCTHMHDFLIGYETGLPKTTTTTATATVPVDTSGRIPFARRSLTLQSTAQTQPSRNHWQQPSDRWGRGRAFQLRDIRCTSLLKARHSEYDENDNWDSRGGRSKRAGGKKKRYDKDDDDDTDSYAKGDARQSRTAETTASTGPTSQTDEAALVLRASVAESIRDERWKASSLDDEKNSEQSRWRYRGELHKAIERISEGLVEREEEARLVVLGMVAQENILFLGPPGTAKSILGRRLSQLCGGMFFQRLLTKFTTPEEIFGPLSLRALENDEYRRKTDGFLPTATVAFLDEIFKANSAILNTLLTILNERQFDNGAGIREDCPIRCVVGASNELPESDELDALYDRFLLRKEVLPVSDEGIVQMLGMPLPGLSPCDGDAKEELGSCGTVFTDDLDALIKGLSLAADSVAMDEEACALMRELRSFMREDLDVNVSDRRLVKAARLLKVSAACHGRTKVDPVDCLLLQHIIWRMPDQRAAVREWLWNNITPGSSGMVSSTTIQDESLESAASSSVRHFRLLLDGLRREAMQAVRKTSGDVTGESGARKADLEVIQSLEQETGRVGAVLAHRVNALSRHSELLLRSEDHLWLDPNEAKAAKQLLLPRAEAYLEAVGRTLHDARCLERALSDDGTLTTDNRLSVIELLWEEEDVDQGVTFSEGALAMGMKEAKVKYDIETFRKWKRARKKGES